MGSTRVPDGRAPSAEALVTALVAVAPGFAPAHREAKVRCLDALAGRRVRQPAALARLHEALCFLQAYPDDAAVLERVDHALAVFPRRVGALAAGARRKLYDSGIVGSALDYPFGYPMVRWLAARRPRDVEVVWSRFREGERLEEVLALLASPAEDDAFSEGGFGWRRWLAMAKGGRPLTDLQVLLELFARARLPPPARDWLFESLELPIGWRLRVPRGTRTDARLPWPRPFFHPTGPRRERIDVSREVERPLAGIRRASAREAAELIEAARFAMATRQRELHAFSHPNAEDIWIADPGHGLRVVLVGLDPAIRLPFDGYYAYLALKNGVPAGYGGGWGLFGALEFAVNVFPSFRQGESAFTVTQVLRVYRQLLGASALTVDPYQLGLGNPEALRSGAFYFYHRLGFRPRDPAVLGLLTEEERRLERDRAYRSPPATLRRLARGEVYLTLHGGDGAPERRVRAAELAALVTRHVAEGFGGDRVAAIRESSGAVAGALGLRGWRRWPPTERRALERWALVAALIPDLSRWPHGDRRRLAALIRAKGTGSEVTYLRLLADHRRLERSLRALLGAGKVTRVV